MKNSKKDVWVALGLAWLAFSLYVGFLSKAYVFEGLIRAMPIETGRWAHLFPGNYLLYGPLGLLFHTLLNSLGFHQPAVVSLQIMDALCGAAGVFVFYFLLRRLNASVFAGVVWSLILACSLGYWLWSTDAEDYILSTLLLTINFYFLMKYRQEEGGEPLLLGALHGLAILGHIVNTVYGTVILYVLIVVHGKKGLKPALRYAGAALIVAGGAYGSVIAFVRKPGSWSEAFEWFKGSASANTAGPWSAAKFGEWLKMSAHIVGSFFPPYNNPPAWALSRYLLLVAWILMGVFVFFLLRHFRELYRKHPGVVGACTVWLVAYACVFTRWEPGTMVYRVSDLVPIVTLLFIVYRDIGQERPVWRGAAVALAVCLALGNLGAEIYPRSFASNNPHLERMAFLKANTSENDWITGDSRQDEIYIPYFAQRRPIVIQRYVRQPGLLIGFLNTLLSHGQTVIVTSRVLDDPFWKDFFRRYQLAPKARDPHGFVLYQVRRYHP